MRKLISTILLVLFLGSCEDKPSAGQQVFISTGKTVIDGYWVYLPENYDPKKSYPLILFLQGGAGVSNDIYSTKNDGPSKFALQDIPIVKDSFIILNPHMKVGDPSKNRWSNYGASMKDFIIKLNKTHPIDSSRMFLTGLSYGAGEGMALLNKRQIDFKAFVGVAGRYASRYSNREGIKKSDIWLVHRKDDPQVPARLSIELMNFLFQETPFPVEDQIGKTTSSTILTILDGDTHTGWDETFRNQAVYEWLLSRK